jgi:IS5 family transposase
LNRQLGDEVFHPSSLVNFRNRLEEHQQGALAFKTILAALEEAGLVSRQSRQRLDSTQMFGRVSKMNRLDCVRESLRLALQEVAKVLAQAARPAWWISLWERYVESQADYRASGETLGRKLAEAGADAHRLLEWLRAQPEGLAQGEQGRLLARVFDEQFEVSLGSAVPQPKSKEPAAPVSEAEMPPEATGPVPAQPPNPEPPSVATMPPPPAPLASTAKERPLAESSSQPAPEQKPAGSTQGAGALVEPKGKGQLDSGRVQNPHDPDATYAVKGQGEHKKEHVGYKVQVAETVCEATLAPGEPTRNFIVGMVTQPAYQSDEAGALLMEAEQAAMGLDKPPVQYVDGAYISAQKLVQAQAEGRELIGPAQPALQKDGRFTSEDFQINVEERQAVCPAGKTNTQCSRLEEEISGKVSYRFEFSTQCHNCSLRDRCLGKDQRHRTLVVGGHHTALQARRQEQQTEPFKARMKHRNAIEGTQSELVRAHGLRRARYRGLSKVKLQNYFIGAACNVKRWIRLEAWKLRQRVSVAAAQVASAAAL